MITEVHGIQVLPVAHPAREGQAATRHIRPRQEAPKPVSKLVIPGSGLNEGPQEFVTTQAELRQDVRKIVDELVSVSSFYNRKLKFDFNEDMSQLVVKVVDGNTDKVIKEVPPEALQRLHVKIKEAIGLLFDEVI